MMFSSTQQQKTGKLTVLYHEPRGITILVSLHTFHIVENGSIIRFTPINTELECGPMPNLMVALPNIGGALCSTPQSLADAHY